MREVSLRDEFTPPTSAGRRGATADTEAVAASTARQPQSADGDACEEWRLQRYASFEHGTQTMTATSRAFHETAATKQNVHATMAQNNKKKKNSLHTASVLVCVAN